MMPLFCGMKWEMRDRVGGMDDVDFVAGFADGGVIGGDVDDVLKVLRGEFAISREYGFRCNFDKMFLHPLVGRQFTGASRVSIG